MNQVMKDPNLPHQICFTSAGTSQRPVVSCNCWKSNKNATAFSHHFGEAPTLDVAWRLYSDPANHRGVFNAVPRH